MSAKDSWIVEYAPWILTGLGVLLIALDGPLPFMDIFGIALIGYGRALGATYKLVDIGVALDGMLSDEPSIVSTMAGDSTKPNTPVRLGAPHGSRSSRTKSLYGLGVWCNVHKRIDNCKYLRSPR